ncbi:putative Bro-N domain-containing protein 4 [Diachasmimorpha longicaudata entomopoxvirus]|uniref:Putative Bro-N domain-containing protein 4 n=1 Tax=Diachasmimorpha longicaudata entomopoxvirus TaxID=109981 RepID=A0A7R5WJ90_9POXV|nr:putative Bro-N domain-containing protein 4 [Diachasmimorpha longicaudata entomopoxvirus]AKS26373.1 putative Bro-N domain-containing protein 4 [Diachasmimorpha longicaudata entomopoxvirus]
MSLVFKEYYVLDPTFSWLDVYMLNIFVNVDGDFFFKTDDVLNILKDFTIDSQNPNYQCIWENLNTFKIQTNWPPNTQFITETGICSLLIDIGLSHPMSFESRNFHTWFFQEIFPIIEARDDGLITALECVEALV